MYHPVSVGFLCDGPEARLESRRIGTLDDTSQPDHANVGHDAALGLALSEVPRLQAPEGVFVESQREVPAGAGAKRPSTPGWYVGRSRC